MKQFVAPETPEEMLRQLQRLLPGFDPLWEDEDQWPGLGCSFHAVTQDLASYFSAQHLSFNDKPLRAFAFWFNGMVAAGGELENAVSTCFLEHSGQLGVYKVLSPQLTTLAKASARA